MRRHWATKVVMACLLIVYKVSSLWKQKTTVNLTSVARFLSVLRRKKGEKYY